MGPATAAAAAGSSARLTAAVGSVVQSLQSVKDRFVDTSSDGDGATRFAKAWSNFSLRFRDENIQQQYYKSKENSLNITLASMMILVAAPLWSLHCSRPWDLDLPPLFIFNSYWFYFAYCLPLYSYFLQALHRQRLVAPEEQDATLTPEQKATLTTALAQGAPSSTAAPDTRSESSSSGATARFNLILERRLKAVVPMGGAITVSSLLLARCIDSRVCQPADLQFINTFRCNPIPGSMPTETALVVMILPFFMQQMLKLTFVHALCLQVVCWGTFLICVIYLRDGNMGAWSVVIAAAMVILIVESEVNSAFTFYRGTREVTLMAELSASKQSQALFSQRTRLVRRVSHEMRSPMFVMSTSLEGIKEMCETGEADLDPAAVVSRYRDIQELVSFCLMSRETALANLDELMLLDKVQSGLLEIRKETVAIAPFLADILAMTKRSPHDKHFVYNFDDQTAVTAAANESPEDKSKLDDDAQDGEDDTTPVVSIDKFRFRQVFQNLLTNSQKFTQARGAITLRLSRLADTAAVSRSRRDSKASSNLQQDQSEETRPSDPPSSTALNICSDGEGGFVRENAQSRPFGFVLIEVADTGLGISETHLQNMFTEGVCCIGCI